MELENVPQSNPAPESVGEPSVSFEQRIGITAESLRKIFDKPDEEKPDVIKRLQDLIKSRIEQTRRWNFADYRQYAAVDEAYNAPTRSITPTLLSKILSTSMDDRDVLKSLKEWRIPENELISEVIDSGDQKRRVLTQRTFWKVQIPLVKSIVGIRVAKLWSERDNDPFFDYIPTRSTEVNRVKCAALTALAERIVQQYGIKQRVRQGLLQAGLYGTVLAFFAEPWHREYAVGADGKKRCVREGVRLVLPHISRCGYDLNWPISTINTGTGCEWALHWRVVRYGDICGPHYWNKDRVVHGYCWFAEPVCYNFFKEVYPCVAQFPILENGAWTATWHADREYQNTLYSSTEDYDKPCFLTDIHQRLVPSEWGLGDYDCPVWFRFQVASDSTVVHAVPLPDCDVFYLGWDTDESRATNSSLALEVLPHNDLLNNIMSQHALTVKQNLVKIIPFDRNQISPDQVKELQAKANETMHILFLPYDSREFKIAGLDPSRMFTPINLGYQDTTGLISAINTVVSIMERLLSMSANESGVNAPRVTTAEESAIVSGAVSTRLQYTDSYVDDFIDALKRRLARYMIAYMDQDFAEDVSDVSDEAVNELKALGFEIRDRINSATENKATISGKKELLDVDSFVSVRDGRRRIDNGKLAATMMQTFQAAAPILADGQPETRRQLLDLLDRIAQAAGVPKDFTFANRLSKMKQAEQQPKGPSAGQAEVMTKLYKDAPFDVKQQIEAALGMQPSQIPPPELLEAQQQAQAQQGAPQQIAQVAQQIQQGAVQQSVQAVSQGIQPVVETVKKLQQEFAQLAKLLNENRQQDQSVAQAVEQLGQMVNGIIQVVNNRAVPVQGAEQ